MPGGKKKGKKKKGGYLQKSVGDTPHPASAEEGWVGTFLKKNRTVPRQRRKKQKGKGETKKPER